MPPQRNMAKAPDCAATAGPALTRNAIFQDRRQLPSVLLVTLQFGLLAVLLWLLPRALPSCEVALPVAVELLLALLLAVWALRSNRLGNFNIRPIPRADGVLVTHGAYRRMRHPMYTSFLLGAFALARLTDDEVAWLVWAMLAVVLWIKAGLEERWMLVQHPGYAAYREGTGRFLPCLS